MFRFCLSEEALRMPFGGAGGKAARRLSPGTSFLLVISPICTVQQAVFDWQTGEALCVGYPVPACDGSVFPSESTQSTPSWHSCAVGVSLTSADCPSSPCVLNHCAAHSPAQGPSRMSFVFRVHWTTWRHIRLRAIFVSALLPIWCLCLLRRRLPGPGSLLELWLNLSKLSFQHCFFFFFFLLPLFCNVYN